MFFSYRWFYLATLFLLFHQISWANSQPEVLLTFAKKQYLKGNIQQAEEKASQVLKDDPANPTANIIHGLTLLSKGGMENLITAKDIIENFSRQLNEDAFAYYALGELYKSREMVNLAKKYFEKAVESDSGLVEALISLGEIYFNRMLEYYNRYTDTEVPLSFRDYAIDDYDYAVYYLKEALATDPFNKKALYLLGSIYYEVDEFKKMVDLFTPALEQYPADKNLNLIMGLADLAKHDYTEASEYFNRALEQMSGEEKELFSDPEYLINSDSIDVSDNKQQEIYWSSKDPMFLTPENERLLEHYGRVAYANMRFSVPKLGVEGWQTDRGKTFIRYGKPSLIVAYGKSMEMSAVYSPNQIWVYPRFKLMFSDEFWNGEYKYTQPFRQTEHSMFKERTNVNFELVAEDVFQEVPETFKMELPGGTFFAPFQLAFFKGKQATDALLSFGLPLDEDFENRTIDLTTGFFLLGKNKLPVYDFTSNLHLDSKKNQEQVIGKYLVNGLDFESQPGAYPYSFEIINKTAEENFVYRDNLEIPDFSGDTLQMSDLLLASDIHPAKESGPFSRHDLYILPNIERKFLPREKVFLYFEVYNLKPDTAGDVHYTVENSLALQQKGGILHALFGGKKHELSIVNEYSGRQQNDFVIQSFDIENLPAGSYDLTIIVKDGVSSEKIQKKTHLSIKEPLSD